MLFPRSQPELTERILSCFPIQLLSKNGRTCHSTLQKKSALKYSLSTLYIVSAQKRQKVSNGKWKFCPKSITLENDIRVAEGGDERVTAWGTSVQFSRPVVSDSLWPHGLQHARPPCPSPTPGVYSNSCPSSWQCHPTISSSVFPFSFCLQSFPASGSFLFFLSFFLI